MPLDVEPIVCAIFPFILLSFFVHHSCLHYALFSFCPFFILLVRFTAHGGRISLFLCEGKQSRLSLINITFECIVGA